MKNSNKGFIIPLLIIMVAAIAIGGGFYAYRNNNNPNNSPVIYSIDPNFGSNNSKNIITGKGFTLKDNTLLIEDSKGNEYINGEDVTADNSTSISVYFNRYGYLSSYVPQHGNSVVPPPTILLPAGTYKISVKNSNGVSNKVLFTIVDATSTNSRKGENPSKNSSITVTNPKEGEVFRVGQVVTVTWNAQETTGSVYINLVNGGKSFGESNKPIPASQGSTQWIVPDMSSWGITDGYQILINDSGETQGRSGSFSIVK